MKTQLGVPTGIALALLSTLLATLFAMGVFSVAQAQDASPSASRTFEPATVQPGGQVVVTISVSNYGNAGIVSESLPAGFRFVESPLGGTVTGQRVQWFFLSNQNIDSFTYTVRASDTVGSHTFAGEFDTRVGDTDYSVDIGGETSEIGRAHV